MAFTLQESSVDGIALLNVESQSLLMQIAPTLGAKVVSLRHRALPREFLWRQPDRALRAAPYGAAFDQFDISGWDECFPTIGEVVYPLEPWKRILVPDHGEVWTLPWHWQREQQSLRMWTHSVRFGYRFERTFHFDSAGSDSGDRNQDDRNQDDHSQVAIEYKVTNPTPFPLHALWSMHPFFNVAATSQVLLPPGVRMRVEISTQERVGHFLSEIPWPLTTNLHTNQPIDLSIMGPPQPVTEKLYTTPLSAGWAALYHPDDDSFVAFTFDPQEIPFVGVCQIRGGWPPAGVPTYSILLEPCTGWPDRLDLALSRGAAMLIPGDGSATWRLTLHVGRGRRTLEEVVVQRNAGKDSHTV